VFDPIAWFEGTGEDLGLPPGYLEDYNRRLAENTAMYAARAQKVDIGTDDTGVHAVRGSKGNDPALAGEETKSLDDPATLKEVENDKAP
jgi:hypothetical protein